MTTRINAIYTDVRGSESIVIRNDGQILRTRIRGVDFEGRDFDGLEPLSETSDFGLKHGELRDCFIAVDLPIRLVAPEGVRLAFIHADFDLSVPGYVKRLTIEEPEFKLCTEGHASGFEYGLLWMASQLPNGFALQACITCGLSDYSPCGSGEFGCLACFRDVKEEYRLVRTKQGIFDLWNRATESVQETYYCPEFEGRPKGRGYRG